MISDQASKQSESEFGGRTLILFLLVGLVKVLLNEIIDNKSETYLIIRRN